MCSGIAARLHSNFRVKLCVELFLLCYVSVVDVLPHTYTFAYRLGSKCAGCHFKSRRKLGQILSTNTCVQGMIVFGACAPTIACLKRCLVV